MQKQLSFLEKSQKAFFKSINQTSVTIDQYSFDKPAIPHQSI